MREILLAIQETLQFQLPLIHYRKSDIFIATSETNLPTGTRPPAFGIKDGLDTLTELQCSIDHHLITVSVICWAPAGGGDKSQVIGDQSQPGVLKMSKDIGAILRNNLLGLEGMKSAKITTIQPSIEMETATGTRTVQQQIISFEYEREVSRA